ncbi:D-2-hydroxyacid dehydrogenase [Aquibacillus kalidii]|uniref:D-2-hydroxyacid dehydrogenase n=1 Tax=Aquibacillus kalidii TaxID=2762597 RepID=UPI0016443B88|nr:D-2-hydroxyacid dehydrogenase [Aquibacillus kalidii]
MSTSKILIAQDIDNKLVEAIRKTIPNWEVIVGKDDAIWSKHMDDAEVIAGWKEGMENIVRQANTNLRWIQSWSAGVDYYPLQDLENKSIYLTSATGVHAYPISETIFAMMLGFTRKLHSYVRNQVNKRWANENINGELHGKTIGIIGVGAIGKETAKIANAFGMKVIGVRNSKMEEPYIDQMVTTNQVNEILPNCDFIVVTLPLTQNTYHYFGPEQFNLMKPSSFFVNIGRGEVVNEQALIQALKNQQIAGAGLDVFEKEPLDKQSSLWEMENVIITPHTAGATAYYDNRVVEDILIPNLKQYITGNPPFINLVNYDRGY